MSPVETPASAVAIAPELPGLVPASRLQRGEEEDGHRREQQGPRGDTNECVLLVEDDPLLREVVTLVLEGAGYRVLVECDGPEGLARFRAAECDLVVLNVMLPSLGGLEVCRQIRRASGVPILVLSARDGAGDVVAGLEAGADDYLTKPFDAPELVARARSLLRRRP